MKEIIINEIYKNLEFKKNQEEIKSFKYQTIKKYNGENIDVVIKWYSKQLKNKFKIDSLEIIELNYRLFGGDLEIDLKFR